ncbi:MAG: hypothetical protein NZ869_09240 [Thermoanaerobaculum sp.]|nr:hypothetical protein [Thermoanaerobaculum sp.]MDW7966553.1 hypothetical protein [Thermoanaerobaculum sp.]
MACWFPAPARAEFYAGSRGYERPRWLRWAGEEYPVEVLREVHGSGAAGGFPQRTIWLVRAGGAFFRVRVVGEEVVIERWGKVTPPRGIADLLA